MQQLSLNSILARLTYEFGPSVFAKQLRGSLWPSEIRQCLRSVAQAGVRKYWLAPGWHIGAPKVRKPFITA
jgi:hypothetical protein